MGPHRDHRQCLQETSFSSLYTLHPQSFTRGLHPGGQCSEFGSPHKPCQPLGQFLPIHGAAGIKDLDFHLALAFLPPSPLSLTRHVCLQGSRLRSHPQFIRHASRLEP